MQHYNTLRKIFLRSLTLVLLLTGPGWVKAQLNGTYTLNSSSATGGTNFNNWTDFTNALNGASITGPVTLNVQSNFSVSSAVTFNANSGASSTNTIKINGGGYATTRSTAYEVFLFNGIDYMTFDNVVVRNSASSLVIGIRLTNASDYNTISNCTIDFTSLTSASTSNSAGIAFASTSTSLGSTDATDKGSYNTITKNTIQTQSGSPGPSYGISYMGNYLNYTGTPTNNTISDNIIKNFYYIGIVTLQSNGIVTSGNDISRANSSSNNGNTTLLGIMDQYAYGTSRSAEVSNNNIHDLPFSGATNSTGVGSYYGVYSYFCVGTSTYRYKINKNTVQKLRGSSSTGVSYGIYGGYNNFAQYDGNIIDDLSRSGTSSSITYAMFGIWASYGTEAWITQNTIRNLKCSASFYGVYSLSTTGSTNRLNDNTVKDNGCYGSSGTWYSLWISNTSTNSNWDVMRNTVTGNNSGLGYGYQSHYDLYTNQNMNLNISSNLFYNNQGYFHYGIRWYIPSTSITVKVVQNTVYMDHSGFWYTYNYCDPFTGGIYGNFFFRGNIFVGKNAYYSYVLDIYGTATNVKEMNHNTYFLDGIWGGSYYYWVGGNGATFTDYYNSGFAGLEERYHNPNFVNATAGNFKSLEYRSQNNVPTNSTEAPDDVTKAARNIVMSDRGAVENYMDLENTKVNFSVPSNVCAGWEGFADITVKNNFSDTANKGFNVAYSVNGGPKTSVKCPKDVRTGDTARIYFKTPIKLNTPGTARIAIFIDIPDDNRGNDSAIFTTNVSPAPGGGKYSASSTPTNAFYSMGKAFDVTQINVPVYYSVNAPRKYSNATYWDGTGSPTGKDWTASVYVTTDKGTTLSGTGSISKHASGTNDLEVKFLTSNSAFEDSTVTVFTKITDLNNGCDTVIRRNVLIYPTITAEFGYPSRICDGDVVSFTQKSKVRSGGMEFFWDFGTGSKADTSAAPEPVFQFPKSGTYKVIMTAKTLPYGFPSYDTADVVVNPNPTVKFTKLNACEGTDLVFTNQTTPTTGVNSTWNFGNGVTRADNSTTVKYKYAKDGAYTVTLTANLNGCIASNSQRVYQFPKPKADYTLASGSCDNDKFEFTNKSSITSGSVGAFWDFGDATYSTDDNAVKMYSSSGAKTVKLVATSEFGCKDSMVKTIQVLESPKMAFVNTPTCSRTPAAFTNTTPTVGGAGGSVKKYSWSFGDGATTGTENPTHQYTSLGDKTVTFAIDLMNGCKGSITKTLKVGIQAKAAFTVADVCLGSPAVFVNTTTWPQGEITYLWNFGDGTTSTSTNPVHTYNKAFSPNVTLYANIKDGCTDSLVINTFNIFEGPRTCDFAVNTDYAFGYYGVALNPLNASTGVTGGQDKVNYTWIFDGGGTNTTSGVNAETKYNFQADGVYNVTMRARSTSAPFCECSKTKQVVMNRLATKDLEETGVAVFPNPNNGQFNLMVKETFGKELSIEIAGISGNVVKRMNITNNGVISINTSDVANGVYMVRVVSGDNSAVRRVIINK